MAVIAGLRTCGILAACRRCSLLNLKIRAALAVAIDNRKLMRADRERVEVIGFQCDNGGTGDRRIILRINQRSVNLNACEFAEIAVCTEGQRSVAVLCPRTVSTFQKIINRQFYFFCLYR